VVVAVVVVGDLVPGSRHRALRVKPVQGYILGKTGKITPGTVVVVAVAVAGLPVATVEQSVMAMPERWQEHLASIQHLVKIHLVSIPGVEAINTTHVE
jgi:hypothetical protein